MDKRGLNKIFKPKPLKQIYEETVMTPCTRNYILWARAYNMVKNKKEKCTNIEQSLNEFTTGTLSQ